MAGKNAHGRSRKDERANRHPWSDPGGFRMPWFAMDNLSRTMLPCTAPRTSVQDATGKRHWPFIAGAGAAPTPGFCTGFSPWPRRESGVGAPNRAAGSQSQLSDGPPGAPPIPDPRPQASAPRLEPIRACMLINEETTIKPVRCLDPSGAWPCAQPRILRQSPPWQAVATRDWSASSSALMGRPLLNGCDSRPTSGSHRVQCGDFTCDLPPRED